MRSGAIAILRRWMGSIAVNGHLQKRIGYLLRCRPGGLEIQTHPGPSNPSRVFRLVLPLSSHDHGHALCDALRDRPVPSIVHPDVGVGEHRTVPEVVDDADSHAFLLAQPSHCLQSWDDQLVRVRLDGPLSHDYYLAPGRLPGRQLCVGNEALPPRYIPDLGLADTPATLRHRQTDELKSPRWPVIARIFEAPQPKLQNRVVAGVVGTLQKELLRPPPPARLHDLGVEVRPHLGPDAPAPLIPQLRGPGLPGRRRVVRQRAVERRLQPRPDHGRRHRNADGPGLGHPRREPRAVLERQDPVHKRLADHHDLPVRVAGVQRGQDLLDAFPLIRDGIVALHPRVREDAAHVDRNTPTNAIAEGGLGSYQVVNVRLASEREELAARGPDLVSMGRRTDESNVPALWQEGACHAQHRRYVASQRMAEYQISRS
ncbi:hypothetical protein PpBr36_02804 [Pyricularia pennisetigena]|uniref:hypothetical protein n=1 Tax=Pyricularia pennisetigena TaxID=1578925 RepID=UPI00114E0D39|nr:hypothetical protein PpBr36_02804 [Pyricularia pennisetigena]TLS30056.1 hypothetical protein PpBr36_02804 [Pyricularia pennisetigena]